MHPQSKKLLANNSQSAPILSAPAMATSINGAPLIARPGRPRSLILSRRYPWLQRIKKAIERLRNPKPRKSRLMLRHHRPKEW